MAFPPGSDFKKYVFCNKKLISWWRSLKGGRRTSFPRQILYHQTIPSEHIILSCCRASSCGLSLFPPSFASTCPVYKSIRTVCLRKRGENSTSVHNTCYFVYSLQWAIWHAALSAWSLLWSRHNKTLLKLTPSSSVEPFCSPQLWSWWWGNIIPPTTFLTCLYLDGLTL